MACGAELEANRLLKVLTEGEDFTIPDVDMSGPTWDIPGGDNSPAFGQLDKLNNESLTSREVNGAGIFDALMESTSKHLLAEFKNNRITGGDYVKAYIANIDSCMANAVQFLLGRDSAYYQAVLAQIQAVTARINLSTAKAGFIQTKAQALGTKAEYALNKLRLPTESENYCAATFNVNQMLPKQLLLVSEQAEAQRAQTQDVRTDGAGVSGSVGKQVALYNQQIISYQRDAEVKAGKLFTDAWTVQKTIDEGLLPPDGFTNASLDRVLTTLKNNNGLG